MSHFQIVTFLSLITYLLACHSKLQISLQFSKKSEARKKCPHFLSSNVKLDPYPRHFHVPPIPRVDISLLRLFLQFALIGPQNDLADFLMFPIFNLPDRCVDING